MSLVCCSIIANGIFGIVYFKKCLNLQEPYSEIADKISGYIDKTLPFTPWPFVALSNYSYEIVRSVAARHCALLALPPIIQYITENNALKNKIPQVVQENPLYKFLCMGNTTLNKAICVIVPLSSAPLFWFSLKVGAVTSPILLTASALIGGLGALGALGHVIRGDPR